MAKVSKIIKKIEKFAPLETQQNWDNSGWQINLNNKETHKEFPETTPRTADSRQEILWELQRE